LFALDGGVFFKFGKTFTLYFDICIQYLDGTKPRKISYFNGIRNSCAKIQLQESDEDS